MGFIRRSIFSMVVVLILPGLTPAQGSGYAVQFGAFSVKEEAEDKLRDLKAKDVAAYIVKTSIPGKGVFYRVRAGFFTNQNQAKRFGASLQERGLVSEYFITAYEKPNEPSVTAAAPKTSPQAPPKTNQPASNNLPAATNSAPNLASNPGLRLSDVGVPATPPSLATAPPVGFLRYQDPKIGYSFDYPNYWMGQPLTDKEASDQRMSAGAVFTSQRDAAFLYTVWNELDKANNPANENDVIVEVILKGMSLGDGSKLEETARRVESRNGLIKTYLDLKAAFQTQGQSAPLDFLGKAVIVRASRGIMLVVTFYSKDAPPNAEVAADMIIASVRPPE
ncbi:MAG TPA: SPOR domain-containing protein [Blastocatellia bacterium]|nr:SPOR domain-containing protein [Blastocatellia bacterium]